MNCTIDFSSQELRVWFWPCIRSTEHPGASLWRDFSACTVSAGRLQCLHICLWAGEIDRDVCMMYVQVSMQSTLFFKICCLQYLQGSCSFQIFPWNPSYTVGNYDWWNYFNHLAQPWEIVIVILENCTIYKNVCFHYISIDWLREDLYYGRARRSFNFGCEWWRSYGGQKGNDFQGRGASILLSNRDGRDRLGGRGVCVCLHLCTC